MDSIAGAGWPAIIAAMIGVGGAIAGQWLGRHMDLRRQMDRESGEAKSKEREEVRLGYQGIIASLQGDQQRLWKMFNEMQVALEKCEQAHREDAVKIRALETENQDQARRIRDLERAIE